MENNALFGGVFYINLEKRTDRRDEIESELRKMGIKAERFIAVENSYGIVGCGYSHLHILKMAREQGLKNVLIFEDDFEFVLSKEDFWNKMEAFFKLDLPYNAVMLSHNIKESQPYNDLLVSITCASTSAGYMVNSCCYDQLIEIFEVSIPLLESTQMHWIYANDQIWHQLMEKGGWYAFHERLGKQRPSFSDISQTFVDYGV